jgi:hypothetical protein
MIAHVILFKPKAGFGDAEQQTVLDGLRAAARTIPAIKKLRVGRRIKHGLPGYEQAMREDFEYSLIVEVDDLDGLKAYLTHPLHKAIGQHFTQSSSAALAYDYEMLDL